MPPAVMLHLANCTGSVADIFNMEELLRTRPSMSYIPQTVSGDFIGYRTQGAGSESASIPPLWHACAMQHVNCVRMLLEVSPLVTTVATRTILPTERDILSFTYNRASKSQNISNYVRIFEILLARGVKIPCFEVKISEMTQNDDMKEVLQKRERKFSKIRYVSDILLTAVSKNHASLVEALLQHGAYPDPVLISDTGEVAPLYPTLAKHLQSVPRLRHRDLDTHDPPLVTAAIKSRLPPVETIRVLLQYGASVPAYRFFDRYMVQSLVHFDMVLNYHASAHKLLRLMQLYFLHGGSLWGRRNAATGDPCLGKGGFCIESMMNRCMLPCQTILDFLVDHITDKAAQTLLVDEVLRMMRNPRSLQQTCRLSIRKSLGYECNKRIKYLPLAEELKEYVRFDKE